MKVEFIKNNGQITNINLIAENDEDKILLELLWRRNIKRQHLVYHEGEVKLETKVSEFDRKV